MDRNERWELSDEQIRNSEGREALKLLVKLTDVWVERDGGSQDLPFALMKWYDKRQAKLAKEAAAEEKSRKAREKRANARAAKAAELNLNLYQIAKIGRWLDDPYGDGIRLEIVREPSEGRLAAGDFVHDPEWNNGYTLREREELIRDEYEDLVRNYLADRSMNIVRQGVLSEDELNAIRGVK